jgi:hypothetical protein
MRCLSGKIALEGWGVIGLAGFKLTTNRNYPAFPFRCLFKIISYRFIPYKCFAFLRSQPKDRLAPNAAQ